MIILQPYVIWLSPTSLNKERLCDNSFNDLFLENLIGFIFVSKE